MSSACRLSCLLCSATCDRAPPMRRPRRGFTRPRRRRHRRSRRERCTHFLRTLCFLAARRPRRLCHCVCAATRGRTASGCRRLPPRTPLCCWRSACAPPSSEGVFESFVTVYALLCGSWTFRLSLENLPLLLAWLCGRSRRASCRACGCTRRSSLLCGVRRRWSHTCLARSRSTRSPAARWRATGSAGSRSSATSTCRCSPCRPACSTACRRRPQSRSFSPSTAPSRCCSSRAASR
jgi:hypothetical protein